MTAAGLIEPPNEPYEGTLRIPRPPGPGEGSDNPASKLFELLDFSNPLSEVSEAELFISGILANSSSAFARTCSSIATNSSSDSPKLPSEELIGIGLIAGIGAAARGFGVFGDDAGGDRIELFGAFGGGIATVR